MDKPSEPRAFGRLLKRFRIAKDLTQEQLADLIGCANHTIRSFETGRRRPSHAMAARIADILAIPLEQRTEFLRLARQVVEGNAAQPTPVAPPQPPTPPPLPIPPPAPLLIGREQEIKTLSDLITVEKQRLVTIVGAGGMGKTRLAQQVATACAKHFSHGSAFVALAAVADGQNVPTTIADALGLALHQALDVGERVLQLLAERTQLLVLDNFEHLLPPSADQVASAIHFVQQILQRCPHIHLLITSRERLRIGQERIFALTGLATPKQRAALPNQRAVPEAPDAVILFIERAQQISSSFALTHENRAAIERICDLLEGMPLALELAASWVRVLSCAEIAEEIQRSLDFLALAQRDQPLRHQSVRAVFDQSWSLLTETERQVLARLAVFRGGCRREAAAAVAEASLPVLASLIDKSLLRRSQSGGSTRYELHELIRQYAEEQLRIAPLAYAITQSRHGAYYLSFAAERDATISSPQTPQVLGELNAEIDNLRLAWDWAIANRRADLLHATGFVLWIFMEMRSSYGEAIELYRRAAQMAQGAASAELQLLWAHMTAHQAYFTNRQMHPVEAKALAEPTIVLLRQQAAPMLLQQALLAHGCACWVHGDFDAGVADFQEGLQLAKQLQRPLIIGAHHMFLGTLLYETGDYTASFDHLTEAAHYFRHAGDPRSLSMTLAHLNRTALQIGRATEIAAGVDEALQIARTIEDPFGIMLALEQKALQVTVQGQLGVAQAYLDEALAHALHIGDRWSQTRVLTMLGDLALHQGDLSLARGYFGEAYQLAQRTDLLAHAVSALAGLAAGLAGQGEWPNAWLLAHYVMDHPASSHAVRQRAAQLYEKAAAHLPTVDQSTLQAPLPTLLLDVLS